MRSNIFYRWLSYLVSYEGIFVILSTVVNVFVISYALGFLKNQHQSVDTISLFLKVFIGLFLVVRFNPFDNVLHERKIFSELDRKVVYSAGFYILMINGVVVYNNYITKEEEKIKQRLQSAKTHKKEGGGEGGRETQI
jgi:hypothetical protein